MTNHFILLRLNLMKWK